MSHLLLSSLVLVFHTTYSIFLDINYDMLYEYRGYSNMFLIRSIPANHPGMSKE